MRALTDFDAVEVRILGVLMEKEQTTPEYYPMTVNSIRTACNQKTNRYPVLNLSEDQVLRGLETLDNDFFVARAGGARADHWKHRADLVWKLNPRTMAVLTLLLLRGAQTSGELRARTERMHEFASLQDVEAALVELASYQEPLALELARRPGQKETRWARSGSPEQAEEPFAGNENAGSTLEQRVTVLEQTVERLELDLKNLRLKDPQDL